MGEGMSKYGCSTLGNEARMLVEDVEHAVLGEYRTPDGWEADPERDPVKEAGDAARELAFQAWRMLVASRAMESVAGLSWRNVDMTAYEAATHREELAIEPYWSWMSEDDD